MSVDVIAFVLGLEDLAELLDLLFHLQKTGNLENVLLGLERLYDLSVPVLVVAVEFRTVVSDPAEVLDILNGVVGGNAHDGAHLVASAVVMRRPAFSAYSVGSLKNGVILITLLFEIHACRKTGRAAAYYADACFFVH